MKNTIPRKIGALIYSADRAAHGASLHGTAIKLHHHTETTINGKRDALHDADSDLTAGNVELGKRRKGRVAAIKASRSYLMLARDTLKPHLGSYHVQEWNLVGFDGSLRIPSNVGDLLRLLENLAEYLTDNPDRAKSQLDITIEKTNLVKTELSNADIAVDTQKSACKTLQDVRETARQELRQSLIGLKGEMTQLMGPMDPRWLEFGFQLPGILARPEMPTNLIAVLIGSNAISMKWSAGKRAKYYRVWVKIDGVSESFDIAGIPADLDFTIDNLPANTLVEVAVSAMNKGGESPRTEPVPVRTL